VLWTLYRLVELSIEVAEIQNVTPVLSSVLLKTASISGDEKNENKSSQIENELMTNSSTNNVSRAATNEDKSSSSLWKYHSPTVEGVEFKSLESEGVSTEMSLHSVRLLLTLLCLGDKSNEAVIFRALPESFAAFLSFKPSYNANSNEINGSIPSSSNAKRPPILTILDSIPRIHRILQGHSLGTSQSITLYYILILTILIIISI
jgi:hypothetical protein